MRRLVFVAVFVSVAVWSMLAAAAGAAAGGGADEALRGLEYRLVGPAAGGRVSRVAGVAGDPRVVYAAAAAGGVWKSSNGGLDWKPVFDQQPVSSTGSIAVSPADPNLVWVGSGEANIRGNVAEGNGIYRSTDGGASWQHVWVAEGQIGTIAAHPTDVDVAFAAVLGSPFGPGQSRGVYRTTDGGTTWQRVLFVDAETGASDVCLDPSNPRIVWAGMWQARRQPWALTSGGPGSGLYRSRDGGTSWTRLTGAGLPGGVWGRVGVRVAPSDARRVYALIEAEEGGLFRSDDGGESFTRVNASRGLRQRAWYYSTLTVHPSSPDVVWFPQVRMLRSIDGGATVRSVAAGGWDYHDVWIDPVDPRRMVVASDAGVSVTQDGGESWYRPPLPISQFYRIAVDGSRPYRVMGSLQDWGTVSGPSNSLHGGGILRSDWHPVGGGEAGHVAPHPADPDVIFAGEYQGYISRFDGRTGQAPHVGVYPDNGSGRPAAELAVRFQWTAPILLSPHDAEFVYHAGNVLFRSADGGQSWTAISPDLTRNDRDKQGWSGGPITGDITGVETYGTIFALAESPVVAGVLWAGTDDGRVHVSRDGGGSWSDVTPGDLPAWGTVRTVEASRFDAGTAWVVVDAHRLDDERPDLWRTADYGRRWARLGADLDPEVYLHVVREDVRRPGLLFLGTERGVMASHDAGATWRSLQLNLPTVAVTDLVVAGDDLVIATIGRSAWILDDITPVRECVDVPAGRAVHLYPPRPTVQWRYAAEPHDRTEGAASNPPEGALVSYFLADEAKGEVVLEVLDAAGSVVRRLSSAATPRYTPAEHPDADPKATHEPALKSTAGLNRVAWDLRAEGARWVPGSRIDTGGPPRGPRVVPGSYTVRLTVNGTVLTQPVEVLQDPRIDASADAVEAQAAFLLGVRDRLSRIADMVATIRALRAQLAAARSSLPADEVELCAVADRLNVELDGIEAAVHNPAAEVGYDILAGRDGGAKLYSRLAWLYGGALPHTGPPTQGMREVAAALGELLDGQEKRLAALLNGELRRFNELAAARRAPHVALPPDTP